VIIGMTAWKNQGEDGRIHGQNLGGTGITIAVVFRDIIVMIRGLGVVNIDRITGDIDS